MCDMQDREVMPLASFCLKSFNQRKYLGEALKGAFAQTYRPLEIVISDDGSTDGPWEYIQAEVAVFHSEHDDVQIVLNHNENNLGNLGNWQKCCELAHGEMLIKADGDDISLPDRTTRVMEAWVRGEKKAKMVSCAAYAITPHGKRLGRVAPTSTHYIRGAMCAWTRECYLLFSPSVRYPNVFDDHVYARRVMILGGGEIHLQEILVLYRIGTGASTDLLNIRKRNRGAIIHAWESRRQVKMDIGEHESQFVREWLRKDFQKLLNLLVLTSRKLVCVRCMALHRLMSLSPCRFFSAQYFQRVCFVLPSFLGSSLLFAYALCNYLRKRMQAMFSFARMSLLLMSGVALSI